MVRIIGSPYSSNVPPIPGSLLSAIKQGEYMGSEMSEPGFRVLLLVRTSPCLN